MENYNKIIYVIDMVKGFVFEGPMHDEYIAHTIDEQTKLIKKFKKEKQGVAFANEYHDDNCVEFESFPPHCVIDSSECELIDEFKVYKDGSLIYLKNSTNAIFAPSLINDLSKMSNLKEIVIVGCCTDICILNFALSLKTYLNQINRAVTIFIIENATETYNAPNHSRGEYNEIAYKLMKLNGIVVVKDLKELEEKEQHLFVKGGR